MKQSISLSPIIAPDMQHVIRIQSEHSHYLLAYIHPQGILLYDSHTKLQYLLTRDVLETILNNI